MPTAAAISVAAATAVPMTTMPTVKKVGTGTAVVVDATTRPRWISFPVV